MAFAQHRDPERDGDPDRPLANPYNDEVPRLALVAAVFLAGCSSGSGIVGAWKGPAGAVTLFTTFDSDGTFHAEERDSDRGQPIARSHGAYTFKNGVLTEDFDRQSAVDPAVTHHHQSWTAKLDGDELDLAAGTASETWRRTQ